MQGHIRRRGKASYEYIVDVGTAAAQRCSNCGRRFWVERKPRPACPRCGGSLIDSEVHSCLHRALRDAVRWGRLVRNPADAADPPRLRGSAHEMRTWSAQQLQLFLASTSDERLGGLWHLLALTGMRRGEALGLRWEASICRPADSPYVAP